MGKFVLLSFQRNAPVGWISVILPETAACLGGSRISRMASISGLVMLEKLFQFLLR
jgi:hypothetical protein